MAATPNLVTAAPWHGASAGRCAMILQRWMATMEARPACQRGVEVPVPLRLEDFDEADREAMAESSRKILQT